MKPMDRTSPATHCIWCNQTIGDHILTSNGHYGCAVAPTFWEPEAISVAEMDELRLRVAKKIAAQAASKFSERREYWLWCADEVLAIAAAARQGGDGTAPGEAPQSGGDSRIAPNGDAA